MRLAVFGLSLSSAWGNGQTTHWRALLRGLATRGHHTTFHEREQAFYASHRDLRRAPWCELRFHADWGEARERILPRLGRFDGLMLGSFCPGGARIADDLLQRARPRLVFHDLDTPVTLEGLEGNEARILDYLRAEQIPEFALYLSFTGGPTLEQLRRRWGARRVAALPLCVDPEAHAPRAPAGRMGRTRMSCLATHAGDRWAALCELLLEPARRLPHQRFVLAGPQYPAATAWPPNLQRREHVGPRQHAAFYAACDYTLNLTRAAMRRAGWSPSARLFEAAACGTPLLSDDWPGLDAFFEPGREVGVVASADEVCRLLGESRGAAQRRAWRARRRVLAHHTGRQRARELEQLLAGVL